MLPTSMMQHHHGRWQVQSHSKGAACAPAFLMHIVCTQEGCDCCCWDLLRPVAAAPWWGLQLEKLPTSLTICTTLFSSVDMRTQYLSLSKQVQGHAAAPDWWKGEGGWLMVCMSLGGNTPAVCISPCNSISVCSHAPPPAHRPFYIKAVQLSYCCSREDMKSRRGGVKGGGG